jgi:hypothetical protein
MADLIMKAVADAGSAILAIESTPIPPEFCFPGNGLRSSDVVVRSPRPRILLAVITT